MHESYEAKLGKVKEDLRAQLQLKDEALEAAKIKILDIEVPGHTTNALLLRESFFILI